MAEKTPLSRCHRPLCGEYVGFFLKFFASTERTFRIVLKRLGVNWKNFEGFGFFAVTLGRETYYLVESDQQDVRERLTLDT